MTMFWAAFQENWLILNSFPKPLIAAINGNALLVGAFVVGLRHYRIMARHAKDQPAKPFRIGLNETKLGIVASVGDGWLPLRYAVLARPSACCSLGDPTAEEALAIGLVDAVVDEADVLARPRRRPSGSWPSLTTLVGCLAI